jgi:hypothetical protein
MKSLLAYFILLIKIINITNGLTVKNKEEKSSLSLLNIDKNFKLSNGPIFCSGWIKFNKFLKAEAEDGKNIGFVKNNFFKEQFKEEESVDLSIVDSVII